MSSSVNKVILVGNLGADPEVRNTQDGKSICNLRLATTDTWRDRQSGERREKTEWHSIVIFNEQLAKIAQQHLKKGAKIYIEGQLQTRKWQDNSGNDRYTTEVVLQNYNGQLTMLDGRPGGSDQPAPHQPPRQAPKPQQQAPRNNFPGRQSHASNWDDEPIDDDIPFT